MAVIFPANPVLNQTYSYGNRSWIWAGTYWRAVSVTPGYTGSKGESSYITSETAPTSPLVGDRWYNSHDALELVWTDDGSSQQWVEVAASGFPGATGYTGSSGLDGAYAGMGYTGSRSTAPGYTGSIGIGLKGDTGYVGSRGDTGFTGSQGVGYTGSVGYAGSASTVIGYTGSWGYFGSVGYSGSAGPGYTALTQSTNTNITVNLAQYNQYIITSLSTAILIADSTNGNPVNGTKVLFRFKDNGTPQSITWITSGTGSWRSIGVSLPTSTVPGKITYVGAIYNTDDGFWDVISVTTQY